MSLTYRFKKERLADGRYVSRPRTLVTLPEKEFADEDVILGVAGIFDAFNITFKKNQNKVTFKRVSELTKLLNFHFL